MNINSSRDDTTHTLCLSYRHHLHTYMTFQELCNDGEMCEWKRQSSLSTLLHGHGRVTHSQPAALATLLVIRHSLEWTLSYKLEIFSHDVSSNHSNHLASSHD